MKNLSKKVALLILLTGIIVPVFQSSVYAVDTDDVPRIVDVPRIDSENNRDWIENTGDPAHTADKIRTSNTYYRTVALTVSRCYPGTQIPTGESYVAQLYTLSTIQSNGVEYNTIGTSYADFLAKASPEWQAEYQSYVNGETQGEYYIKFDAVMVVYENGQLLTNPDGTPYLFNDYDSIAGAEPWANKDGLYSHFNKFIPIRKSKKGEKKVANATITASSDGPDEYDYQVTHDSTAPIEYHEGNSSPAGYDIGTGIPTTEKLHNEYDATSWYAETDVRVRVKYWDEYHKNVSYQFPYWDGVSYHTKEETYTNDLGETKTRTVPDYDRPLVTIENWGHGSVDFSGEFMDQFWQMIPIVSYQYLANTRCLDFSDAEVRNKTFENGIIRYSSSKNIEATCISTNNYIDAASAGNASVLGGKDWYSIPSTDDTVNYNWHGTDATHIRINGTLPSVNDYVTSSVITVGPPNGKYFIGSTPQSSGGVEACERYHMGLRADCRSAIESVISTRNDYLKIDGHVYMGDSGSFVQGCDFVGPSAEDNPQKYSQYGGKTWGKLTKSAGVQQQYGYAGETLAGTDTGTESGSQDTTIPAKVDNGDYETGFMVNYKQIIVNNGSIQSFKCDTEGDEYGYGGGLVPEHLKDNEYGSNSRPGWVFIHTPIISLFNILSAEPDSTGKIPLKEEAVHDNIQLVNSMINGDALAQMRLDNYYVLDFIQTEHLNKTGYGYSEVSDGVEKYSKYDKYTLNKWVKFPFSVIYEDKIYPKNYWILVKSPGQTLTNGTVGDGYKKRANLTAGTKESNWAPTSDNHWRKMPFYIPSWAEEVGGPGNDAKIKILVEAINVSGTYGGDHNGPEYKKGGPTSDVTLNDDGTISIDEDAITYTDPNETSRDAFGDLVDSDKYVTWVLKEQNVTDNSDFHATGTNISGTVDGQTVSQAEEMENLWEQNKNIAQDKWADYPKGAHYCAISELQCQTSGIIYGFTITGSSDSDSFQYEPSGSKMEEFDVAFCTYKQEKTVGTQNRIGGDVVRYHNDGTVGRNEAGTPSWPKFNTLVLTKGKSSSMKDKGVVVKGSRFSYCLKTIANLWGETEDWGTEIKGDFIKIIPTFRYYREDYPTGDLDNGTFTEVPMDKLRIYYDSPTSRDKFIEYGSEADLASRNMQYVQLINAQFDDSYYLDDQTFKGYVKNNSSLTGVIQNLKYGDWVSYTVDDYNKKFSSTGADMTNQEYLNTKHKSFNLSTITLNSGLRFLSGENEELIRNIKGNGNEWETLLTLRDGSPNGKAPGVTNLNSSWEDMFRKSMQTWYGQYYIPANLYIIDLTKHPEMETKTLEEYAEEKGGIKKDDPIFEPNTGYLVINFSILTYNEGTPHLQYGGKNVGTSVRTPSETMWTKEGFDPVIPSPDPTIIPHRITDTIELEDGDVAIIDLSQSVTDRYKAAIFNIN